jgi:hypothetical protein
MPCLINIPLLLLTLIIILFLTLQNIALLLSGEVKISLSTHVHFPIITILKLFLLDTHYCVKYYIAFNTKLLHVGKYFTQYHELRFSPQTRTGKSDISIHMWQPITDAT